MIKVTLPDWQLVKGHTPRCNVIGIGLNSYIHTYVFPIMSIGKPFTKIVQLTSNCDNAKATGLLFGSSFSRAP